MDLGIRGRKALLVGASRGLGKACALALAHEGVDLTIVARKRDALERTAAEIASAISSVIANPQRRQKLSAQGRQWVFENLDLPRLTAAYERLYRSCVDRSAGQGDLPGAGQSFGST